MIPVLFEAGTKNFTTNGIGRLIDALKCDVVEERNGAYELELEYPLDGAYFSEITEDRIIYAKPNEKSDPQPFVVKEISKAFDGKVTIVAPHIRDVLNKYLVMPFTAGSSLAALVELKRNIIGDDIFTFEGKTEILGDITLEEPKTVMEVLGGGEGSFLDTYHGEYEFDGYKVIHHKNRGIDNNVSIRYGKNMTDLTSKTNTEGVYTGVVPYWTGREVTVTVDEDGNEHEEHGEEETIYYTDKVIWSDHVNDYAYKRVKLVDVSEDFVDTKPTDADFENWARTYFANNSIWSMSTDIEVSFVPLWQSEEYKDIALLERVGLCDTVTVIYSKMGVENKLKVIKTDYNVLLERYNSIELGEVQSNFRTTVSDIEKRIGNAEIEAARVKSFAEVAIEIQTNLIRGGLGGHVVMKANAEGLPEEILVMDTEDISTAQKVWRWNMGGFAFSNNGYNGPFDTVALTADGQINANTITTGILNALMIKAGVLTDGIVTYTRFTGSSFSPNTEYFEMISDGDVPMYALTTDTSPRSGKTYYTQTISANTSFDLATGRLTMTKGDIKLGKFTYSGATDYHVTISDTGVITSTGVADANRKKIVIDGGDMSFSYDGVEVATIKTDAILDNEFRRLVIRSKEYLEIEDENGVGFEIFQWTDINNRVHKTAHMSAKGMGAGGSFSVDNYNGASASHVKLVDGVQIGEYSSGNVTINGVFINGGYLGFDTSAGTFWIAQS